MKPMVGVLRNVSCSQNLQGLLGYWNLSLRLSHSHLGSMCRDLLVVSLLS